MAFLTVTLAPKSAPKPLTAARVTIRSGLRNLVQGSPRLKSGPPSLLGVLLSLLVLVNGCGGNSNSHSLARTVPLTGEDRALVGQCFLGGAPQASQIGISCDAYRNGHPKTLQVATVTGQVDDDGHPRCPGFASGYEKAHTGVFLCGETPGSSTEQPTSAGSAVTSGACTNITGIMSFSGSATAGDVVDCSDPHAVGQIYSTDTSRCGTGYVNSQGEALDVVRVNGKTVCVEQGPVEIPPVGR